MNRRSRPPTDPIDAVLADLAARLPAGAARDRHGLLQEASDGLRDAAEAYELAGCPPAEAARRAADEFGDPATLAPDYADEVLRLEARRTSSVLALGYLLVLSAWALLGMTERHAAESQDHSWAASSFGVLGVLAAGVAASVFAVSRRHARSGRSGGVVAWAAGVAGLLCGGATLLASYLVQPWGSRRSDQLPESTWTGPVETFSGLVVGVILLLSLRCVGAAWRAQHPGRRV